MLAERNGGPVHPLMRRRGQGSVHDSRRDASRNRENTACLSDCGAFLRPWDVKREGNVDDRICSTRPGCARRESSSVAARGFGVSSCRDGGMGGPPGARSRVSRERPVQRARRNGAVLSGRRKHAAVSRASSFVTGSGYCVVQARPRKATNGFHASRSSSNRAEIAAKIATMAPNSMEKAIHKLA